MRHRERNVWKDQASYEGVTPLPHNPLECAAVKQGAELIVRLNPFSVVLSDAAGAPLELCTALKRQHTETLRTLAVALRATGGQHEVRGWVHAYRLNAEQANRARQKCRQGHKKGTPKAASLFLAGWVLVFTTLAPAVLSAQTIMVLYRCRWQVELVFKRMKQLLRFNQLRSTHRTTVEATVRALLVAWALQEDIGAEIQTLLRALTSSRPLVISRWFVTGLGIETLRHQVQSTWSRARLRLCLPRLQRFLCCRPRRRVHQDTEVRAWLEGRAPRPFLIAEDAA